MIVSIMQPAYLPWLGYFDRVAASDLHVVLDHVAMDHSSKTKFATRNRIRTPQGWCWLSVPLDSATLREPLSGLRISPDASWVRKHLHALRHNYARAAHYAEHAAFFEGFYAEPHTLLTRAISRSTEHFMGCLGLETPSLRSSELGVRGAGSELILEVCKAVGATAYLSGPFGRDYLDERSFHAAGVELLYHAYEHPEYPQAFPGFEPYMSIVDLLFNCGNDAMAIVRRGRKFEKAGERPQGAGI